MDYAKASFCMEELILSNPHNHLYHLKYAEIKYTQGGPENLEIARAYFSEAAKLNPRNLRSLFGLLMTASGLAVYQAKKCTGTASKHKICPMGSGADH